MYSIEIRISFRAAHRLLYPYIGKCNNVHGEYYTAIFIFEKKKLDECGMVIDFGVIKGRLKRWIDDNLDHSYICHKDDGVGVSLRGFPSKIFTLDNNPTAENIAKLMYDKCKLEKLPIKKVGIVESSVDSIAWYE